MKPTFMLLVDQAKAYDRVPHAQVEIALLRDTKIPLNLVSMIINLVRGRVMKPVMHDGLGKEWKPQRGISQGNVLSPFLYSLVVNSVIYKVEEKAKQLGNTPKLKWVNRRGRKKAMALPVLFYADDIVLLSRSCREVWMLYVF